MNKYLLSIQMYGVSKEIRRTYTSYEEYKNDYINDLRDVKLGYTLMLTITDDYGVEHKINPKYIAWSELKKLKEVQNG